MHASSSRQVIGLISDTHGLLRPEALRALRGVDRILHAGDIGDAGILDRLSDIAPVTAVRGNNDVGAWAQALPEMVRFAVDGVRVLLIHDRSALAPEEFAADVVVSGHSHKPGTGVEQGVRWVNPGSAGPRRFSLPVSVGRIVIDGGHVRVRLRTLRLDRTGRAA